MKPEFMSLGERQLCVRRTLFHQTHWLHYVLAFIKCFFKAFLIFLLLVTFSISMYIMCVTLCLFSALSCRVGALQISIIIITELLFIN